MKVILSLQKILKETKQTNCGSTRFIIPNDWLQSIYDNNLNENESLGNINNAIFLTKDRKRLKSTSTNNIILIVYEIMKYINNNFYIDYIIQVEYDNIKKVFDLNNIIIYPSNNFNNNFESIKYKKIGLESAYLKCSDFSVIGGDDNDITDSTNQLLKGAHIHNMDEKDMSTTIRRINTDSRNLTSSYNSNKFTENDMGQANRSEKMVNSHLGKDENDLKNNKDDNKSNIGEENDTDEFRKDEKIELKPKYYRNITLKEANKEKVDVDSINKSDKNKDNDEKNKNPKNDNLIKLKDNKEKNKKNEKEDKNNIEEDKEDKEELEKYKKYIFNENELTIDLLKFKKEHIKPIGLINPNIYCFMICILQTLLSIPELNYYFLNEFYKNKKEQKDMTICDAYNYFIKKYITEDKYMQIPRNLLIICNRLLGGMRMHDSQEFFVCFLEAIQEELNDSEKCNIPEKATMEQRWIIYRKVNNSFIDSTFTGLMKSTVKCKKCNSESYTYDPFIDLSVSINKYKNLEKCLKQYFENEKIDCEYKCEKCKNVAKVSKLIFKKVYI